MAHYLTLPVGDSDLTVGLAFPGAASPCVCEVMGPVGLDLDFAVEAGTVGSSGYLDPVRTVTALVSIDQLSVRSIRSGVDDTAIFEVTIADGCSIR